MSVTQADIESFRQFAATRVDNGGAPTMQTLLDEWLAEREAAEIQSAVRTGDAELEAGGGQSPQEVLHELREKLGWK